MAARLSISLLGPLEIRLDDKLVGGFESSKVRALLAYLATEAGQAHTRSHLCALLWPESAERAARHSLSQALSSLRQALGDAGVARPYLLATTEVIGLNPAAEMAVDVARFAALLAAAEAHAPAHRGWHLCTPCAERLRQAARLYRGDFLAEFFLSNSAPFEEWAVLMRERQRQRMVSTLERLALFAEWRGWYEQAADDAQRQVALEPLLEGNYRSAMRLLALSGQAAAAQTHYERLRRTLAEELGLPPEAETTQLYEHIRAGQMPAPAHPRPPRSTLPVPPTRLIGRAAEVTAALDLLRNQIRALTLTGPPGIGKTRLALELARDLQFDFQEGVCFVELSPVVDAAQVSSAIAQALGVRAPAGQPLPVALAEALRLSHLLLVLDNFEHVLEAAVLAADLLAACPALKLIVTSRAPLGIRAEQAFPVSPLGLPAANGSREERAHSPAVSLFLERAQAVRPGFSPTAERVDDIGSLCARVDALPLAIELLAARVRTLEPAELLRQLEHGLGTLSHGSRDLPLRQRTLRDAIAWSYVRLSADEQHLFEHLGVFAAGCTLEAAQVVAGGDLDEVLASLEALHQSSLVQLQSGAAHSRFVLLETLREFALEKLQAHDRAESAHQRHAAYFLALAQRAEPELILADQKAWLDSLARELPNLRAALAWGLAHRPASSLQMAASLAEFWLLRGHLQEGQRWLKEALDRGRLAPPSVRAWALLATGRLALRQGELKEAQRWLNESRQLMLQLEEPTGLALALSYLGTVVLRQADFVNGQTYLEQSLSIARSVPDSYLTALALDGLAELAHRQGDDRRARSYSEEVLAFSQARRAPHNIATRHMHLALTVLELGESAAARQHLEVSLTMAREIEDPILHSLVLLNLGNLLLAQGDAAGARAHLEEALALYPAHHYWTSADAVLATLGRALEQLDDLGGARSRQMAALRLRVAGERRAVPISLINLARLEFRENQPARAAQLLAAAEALREAIGTPVSRSRRAEHEQLVAAVRGALGSAAFDAAWAAGRVLSLESAVALALSAAVTDSPNPSD